MKQSAYLTLFIFLIYTCSFILSSKSTHGAPLKKGNILRKQSTPVITQKPRDTEIEYDEDEARFYASFSKAAKCFDKPSKSYFKNYKFFSAQKIMRESLYPYKTFIHLSQEEKRVIISIGSPSNLPNCFYSRLYSEEFKWVRSNRVLLEKEFFEVYYSYIRPFLVKKIMQLRFLGFGDAEYVFNGHSLGGSLAIYTAFDLAKGGILSTINKKPTVYAFGALRIGDASFAAQVNDYAEIWKIDKQTDPMVRAPSCFYNSKNKRWECNSSFLNSINSGAQSEDEENTNTQENTSDLNRNVFDRNKTKSEYGSYYNTIFNPQSVMHSELTQKKGEVFKYFFGQHDENDKLHVNNLFLDKDDIKNDQFFRKAFRKTRQNEGEEAGLNSDLINSNSVTSLQTIIRSFVPINQNTQLSDLNKYSENYIYFSQPIGYHIYYISIGGYQKCKRTYFGASTCEIANPLPDYFYTNGGHNNYLGIDFGDCSIN